ncbi:MAG: type II toxin-antitoxin system Phd/YefM family antitoxin [Microcystaceae cyanobacterium]
MKITNIHQAKTNLSKLIEAVLAGEEVIISKAGKPLVKLIPYTPSSEVRKPGYWRSQVWIAEDFETLPDEVINSFMGEA